MADNNTSTCKHGEQKDACAKCAARRAYVREWRRNNPDKVKAASAKWIAANPDARRQIERDWKARNPDKVAAMNARGGAKWSRNNKGARNALTNSTRAKRVGGWVPWADQDAIRRFYIEADRLTRETGVSHEVDHIIPLRGELISGLHVHHNLRVIPMKENRSKGRKVEL